MGEGAVRAYTGERPSFQRYRAPPFPSSARWEATCVNDGKLMGPPWDDKNRPRPGARCGILHPGLAGPAGEVSSADLPAIRHSARDESGERKANAPKPCKTRKG